MDSSLPVLVSRLPDGRALARLVRAALRHEVVQVELAHGPKHAEAHTLDLHVLGQPPLALLAEPAGAPTDGQYPLRLRPLYGAQSAHLHALLEREDAPPDGPDAADASLSISVVFEPEQGSDAAFFDDALAALPMPEIADEPLGPADAPTSEAHAPETVADARGAEVDDDDAEVDDGALPDDDDGATLIRAPAPAPAVPLPARREAIVRIEARAAEELTPTETRFPRAGSTTAGPPSSPSPAPDPAIGRRIADGKYAIESLIGSGATGSVYRATHRELRRTVAIKLLHPHYQKDPEFMASFRGEALAASQLDHPNVMRVLDFDQEPDGLIYIVMEYLSGRTLQTLLDEERRLSAERAIEIMIQVCAALSVAHDHGIIHRDIKPDNIMLVPSRDDEGASFELVKVCDFGIAALQNPRPEDAELAPARHVIAGTPEYMSPEQARGGPVDPRSDVYACGMCLYELVTGRPPFLGDTPGEILMKQLEEVPKPPSQITKGLDPIVEEIIIRAIQKDPSKRQPSARELRVELKELIEPSKVGEEDEEDARSIVANLPVLDDPASGFTGFFIAFSSAILRFGRFARGHADGAHAASELQRSLRTALRGRAELTFARRDVEKAIGFVVMSGTAEIVDLRRLLGSQIMGSFGQPFVDRLVERGVASLTVREGIPDAELERLIDVLARPPSDADLRVELATKPMRYASLLLVSDVLGGGRQLLWKIGYCASRLAHDLHALCGVRGMSLKKMRETRDELVGRVARLLTRGDEVKQFVFNADLVDEAVADLRGFSSFNVAPLVIERVLHASCAEAAMLLLRDLEAGVGDRSAMTALLQLFAQRLVTERSTASDAAVGALYRHGFIGEADMPHDLGEAVRAEALADALVQDPSRALVVLERIEGAETYARELALLEAAMGALARRSEASALITVMTVLARHAKTATAQGPRQAAALRATKAMIAEQHIAPIATALLAGTARQHDAARQLVLLAGATGASALLAAREANADSSARPIFVATLREIGPQASAPLSQALSRMEARDDAELAFVEDLLRSVSERAEPILGDGVARFLGHPRLRPTALQALARASADRAKRPLIEALEYADEPTRIVALAELRRLHAVGEHVFSVIERILAMKGGAGDELRAAAAAALASVAAPLRARATSLLSKAVEGKRGIVAMLRGDAGGDESVIVMEAMGRALVALDRDEGLRALRARLSRSDGPMHARLSAILATA